LALFLILSVSFANLPVMVHAGSSSDLSVDSIWLEDASQPGQPVSQILPGQSFLIVATIKNIGQETAYGFYLDVYYDGDYGRGGPDNIAPGEVQTWYVGPLTAQAGTHTTTWIADPDNQIAELNESNNQKEYTFTMRSQTTTTTTTTSNSITTSTTETTTATSWVKLAGLTPDSLASATSTDRLYVAARGMENDIWYRSMDTYGVWSDWTRLPGFTDAWPALAIFNSRLYLVCKQSGTDNIWLGSISLSDGSFSGWVLLDGPTPTAVSLATDSSYLYLAAEGMDGSIWHRRMDTSGIWSTWTQVPGFTDVSPAIAVFNGQLYFVCKQRSSSNIWYGYVDLVSYPGGWSGWTLLPGPTPDALTLTVSSDQLYVAARGMENGIWYRSMDSSGTWSDWSRLPGFTDATPAVTAFNKVTFVCKQAGTNAIWYY
jgi:hypothetical protein